MDKISSRLLLHPKTRDHSYGRANYCYTRVSTKHLGQLNTSVILLTDNNQFRGTGVSNAERGTGGERWFPMEYM